MRFLLDQCIALRVVGLLANADHDVVHASQLGLSTAPDPIILLAAAADSRVLVTTDSDFGGLLAANQAPQPSVALFRGDVTRRPERQAALLLQNLEQIKADLAKGAIVVVGDGRLRIRKLPIQD